MDQRLTTGALIPCQHVVMTTEESLHANILNVSPDLLPGVPPTLEVFPQGPHCPLDATLHAVPVLILIVRVLVFSVHGKVGEMDKVIL